MASEFHKKKEKTSIEVQEEYDLALRRLYEAQAKYDHHDIRHKRPTNADRIRAMSDEELVETFHETGCPPTYDPHTGCMVPNDCVACWLDWLKSPVEE